jgi:hypothetical protein
MSNQNSPPTPSKTRDGRQSRVALALLILLLLLAVLWLAWKFLHRPPHQTHTVPATIDTPTRPDTGISSGHPVRRDSAADTSQPAITLPDSSRPAIRKPIKPKTTDTLAAPPRDTTPAPADTTPTDTAAAVDPCQQDTLQPWVYPDPSGGLHRSAVKIKIKANKPCTIEWRMDADAAWHPYGGEPIAIAKSAKLHFKAADSCGKTMEPRAEWYEIKPLPKEGICPEGMEYIEIGATRFCIDIYEWPNRKGGLPGSYVSIYQAQDSCFTVGKKLCTQEQWSMACGGVYGWQYPYGASYEPHACNTSDTTVERSGSKPECRGYFNVYDMSGNLAEWTDTRSARNAKFYNVAGGFWQSGPQSDCFSAKYSYSPENRHNPVGFRCCKEIGQ